MKAIVNVKKTSSAYKHNLKTFEVMNVFGPLINLKIEDNLTMDFSYREVIIVDFEKEIQSAYDTYNWNGNKRLLDFLQSYSKHNKLLFDLEYNCPA